VLGYIKVFCGTTLSNGERRNASRGLNKGLTSTRSGRAHALYFG
jgi:hypothetical protein